MRIVLLKGVDPADFAARGFVFYTNFESAKGEELLASQKAALSFHWKVAAPPGARPRCRLHGERCGGRCLFRHAPARQPARRLGLAAVAAPRKPRGLGASGRSRNRQISVDDIPRPPYWSGFRVTPLEMEFWHDRPFRLHERVAFRRDAVGENWNKQRLYP